MKVAIDISPIKRKSNSAHRVRGVGTYVSLLYENLTNYAQSDQIQFVTAENQSDSDTDLFHIPYFDLFSKQLPFFIDHKIALTIHDLIPIKFYKNFPVGIRGKIMWNLEKSLAKDIDIIITDSISSKRDIQKTIGIDSKSIHVVYLAASNSYRKLNLDEKHIDILEKYNLPKKYLLYVGDATWNKNLPRIIEAVQKTNITLVLVGKVFDQKKVEMHPWNEDLHLVLKTIENNNQFVTTGYLAEEDLNQLYNMALGLVMPSIYEGFGLPILEAMQAGCPVITSEKGSIPEVAEDAAMYADPIKSDNIAECITKLEQNSQLQKEMSKKGLIQAQKFTIEKMMKNTIKAYHSINL